MATEATPGRAVARPRQGAAAEAPPAFRPSRLVVPVLVVGDLYALWLSVGAGLGLRRLASFWDPVSYSAEAIAALILVTLAFPVGYAVLGLYPGYGLNPVERLRRQVLGTGLMAAVLLASSDLAVRGQAPRGAALAATAAALVFVPLGSALVRTGLERTGRWGKPVVVLGAAKTGALVVRNLREWPALGLVPVAALDDDPAKRGSELEGVPVVGPISEAPRLAAQGIRTAIVAMPGAGRERHVELLTSLPFPSLLFVPDLFGAQSLWVTSRDLGGVLALEVQNNLLVPWRRALKRALDYSLGTALFLATLPLVAVLALLIKLVSPGPAFFAQEREGLHGRPFRMWKLRTMYPDAERRLQELLARDAAAREEWERHVKLRNDPRVIPVIGSFLRRTSLDELPQFWNVVRGEMSLVGPRPFPEYHLAKFPAEFRALRRTVRPGVTGLWQVSARSDGDLEVQRALDVAYIRNWSPWLDLYILAKTAGAVVSGRGAS